MRASAARVRITTQPAIEPVSRSEAKLHLRIDHTAEDDLVDRLITAARQVAEDIAQRAFITRTYTAKLDQWPLYQLVLPWPPLITVTGVTYTDDDGVTETFAASNYIVDTHSEPGRIVLRADVSWHTVTLQEVNGVTVVYTAGYGATAADVPLRARQAILLLLADMYENRESVPMPAALRTAEYLLMMDRGGW